MSNQIQIELPSEINKALEERKKRTGVAKSNIVKQATAEYLGLIE